MKVLQRWHSSFQKKAPNATFEASTSWNENRTPCLRKASAFEFPAELFATITKRMNQCWSGCSHVSTEPNAAKCSKTPNAAKCSKTRLHCTVCYTADFNSMCTSMCYYSSAQAWLERFFVEGFWIQLTDSKKHFWRRSQQPTSQKVLIAIIKKRANELRCFDSKFAWRDHVKLQYHPWSLCTHLYKSLDKRKLFQALPPIANSLRIAVV